MNDIGTLLKSTPFSFENRFETDYDIIEEIATGGFSTVYKVRNQLDHSLYAIKKIIVKINRRNKKSIQKDIDDVLQEIRLLARNKSEHVITYNHSWVEVKLKEANKFTPMTKEDPLSNKEGNDLIEFVQDDHSSSELSTDSNEEYLDGQKTAFEKICLNNQQYNVKDIDHLVLYIQMELCKETLFDYIEKRNQSVKRRNLENFLKDNEKDILTLFCSICAAIDYVHSEAKLIHRDLKPRNIFLTEDGKVKIGDFGLATDRKQKKNSKKMNGKEGEHSRNVGTVAYAAPEQLSQTQYNSKADIYSLGLILFELAFPMKTGMEKHSKFEEIKKGNIPFNIKDQSPIVYKLLELMVSDNAKKRPNAKTVLSFVKEYLKNSKEKKPNRKRFFSEGSNEGNKKMELLIKTGDEMWKSVWITMVNGKLLVFNQESNRKANLCYDLNECDISGRFIDKSDCKKAKIKKSHSVNSIHELNPKETKCNLIDQLNYFIEIDHPYLQKCSMKCDNLIDSLDLYNELFRISSN